jgi:hypothetical protein
VPDSNRKVIIMQWVVIAVLLIGAGVASAMLVVRANDYELLLQEQEGSVSSLREQLRQAKNPTPTPSPALPEATGNSAAATPTPSPAPSASPTATPKP